MTAVVLRADARCLPLPDASVDLIVTSPPYFGLRSYTDGCTSCAESARKANCGYRSRHCPRCDVTVTRTRCNRCQGLTVETEKKPPARTDCPDCGGTGQLHYEGQIGSEATPAEFVAALLDCTREWVRVLKPSGSLFVNLGDRYSTGNSGQSGLAKLGEQWAGGGHSDGKAKRSSAAVAGFQPKSLLGLPWRYALGCIDQLGLILRAEIVWAKPNGLPESVTDRVRRSHEQVFHFTRLPRYFAAVDEIREPHTGNAHGSGNGASRRWLASNGGSNHRALDTDPAEYNPLGKLPGSVWTIPSCPLKVPESLGVDHFACVDTETEILTPRGWLRHDQLTAGDRVAGYDLDSNTARWTDCTAVSRYDYDGDMIAVESRDLSMRLTPNHRTIVQRMDTRTKRRSPVSVVRADELDRYHFIPRSGTWERCGDFYVGARLAAVMGWVAAEGWCEPNRVRLSQSLDANPASVAEIDRLIPDATRGERKRQYRGQPYTEVNWTLGLVDSNLIRREMPDKLLPWWLVTATDEERHAVLDAFIDGDGHRRPDGRIAVFQKYRHNLDVLQAIAVTLGYKTTIREGGGRFVLYLTEGGRSVTLRGTAGVGSKVHREHYRGTVWCPATGTGTFIARRNGSVFVTGNSFPPALVRPVVLGWSPAGICTRCGEGRRPVADRTLTINRRGRQVNVLDRPERGVDTQTLGWERVATITGYVCACPTPDAPTRPAVVLDPFGGTGTTALVASVYGRHGITVDMSADYCRLAAWRTQDPAERARAMDVPKPPPVPDGQAALFT